MTVTTAHPKQPTMSERVMALFTETRRTVSRLDFIQAFPRELSAATSARQELVQSGRLRGYGSTWRATYGWPESPPTPVIVPALVVMPAPAESAATPRPVSWREAARSAKPVLMTAA
jgi:hypothetical protein